MAAGEDFEYTCTLSEETLEVAKKQLNEDPSTRLLELKTLRDRLQQYPGLKSRLDPQFLIRFLRARKFDQEKAFDMVLNYYRMRQDPHIFTGLTPSNVKHVYQSEIAFPFAHRDRQGRKVYLMRPARADTSHYTMTEVFKADFLNLSKLIEDEENQVRGFTILVDYKNFSMSNFFQLSPDIAKRSVKLWQDAFPARMRCCLVVNEPPFMDLLLTLFTQFAKAKLLRRILYIGTDWEKLHEYIDPACLPACYGGTLPGDPDPTCWLETMVQCDRQMEEESKFGFVDFTIGCDKDKKHQDAFNSMAGTFKKLDV